MNSAKRPIAVLFLSCLYIAVGTIGFVVNLRPHRLIRLPASL